jgi:twitching motility protein PilT
MSDAVERFDVVLRFAAERQISDVHFKSGQRPLYRRVGKLISRREESSFDDAALGEIAARLLSADEAKRFNGGASIITTYGVVGVGRFRIHVARQRAGISLAIRVLPPRPPALRDLRLPPTVATLCGVENGLVLVAGGRGQGRTSTVAAMIDAINTTSALSRQIATTEAPIEILFDDKLAWICQREVGRDCESMAAGVIDAIDADADVIAVGDIGDAATLEATLSAVEAGKLVLAQVTAPDVASAFRRIEGLVPGDALPAVRARLATALVGAVSVRLINAADGQRRLPAVEVLTSTPQVYAILRGGHDPASFYDIMAASTQVGMQTIDQSLHDMVMARAASVEQVLPYSMRPGELTAMRTKGTRPESGLF